MAIQPAGIDASNTPVQAARALIMQRPWLADGAKSSDLVVTDVTSGAGTAASIIRFDEKIQDIPVIGGGVVAAVDRSNRIVAINGSSLEGAAPSLMAKLTASEAQAAAIAALAKEFGSGLTASTPSLAIYDPRLLGAAGPQRAVLVWDVEVTRGDAVRQRVFVDATEGIVALALDEVENAMVRAVCDEHGRAVLYYCYPDYPPYRGVWTTTRSEGEVPTLVADVNQAYDYSGETYDFYATLGRDSIDNAGMVLRSSVNICPTSCPYANAYWNGFAMFYGSGFAAADDVVGHELTHGVTQAESGLFYYAQSGAINEGLSDVFGQFVDLSNSIADPLDDAESGLGATGKRWLMGEDLAAYPDGIRDMRDPTVFTDPDRTGSPLYYGGAGDHNGVHTNSGVVNKTAYLITDGATFNEQTVAGIGLAKSKRIWYQAALLLHSSSQFTDLGSALESACTTLINSNSITSADCAEVAKATLATELATQPANALTPQAPVCAAGDATPVFADDAEFGLDTAKWSQVKVDLSGAASTWAASASYPASGTQSLLGDNPAGASDNALQQANGIVLPTAAYLRFRHAYAFETSPGGANHWDGGVVEYSTNNGTTWTDISTLTVTNGYPAGTIHSSLTNGLSGRAGFIGNSTGYIATRVDLSTLAGQTVKFRFRIGTDDSGSDYGWFVDDINVYSCTHPLTVVPAGTGTGTVTSTAAGIDCGATCVAPFGVGATVTLTAEAAADSVFDGWTGAGCTGTGTCTVTMDASKSPTATFRRTYVPLTVTKAGTGSGTITSAPFAIDCGATCTASLATASGVTLIASPAANSTFTGWSGAGCSGTGTCSITMSTARSVTATFSLNPIVTPDPPAPTPAAAAAAPSTAASASTPSLAASPPKVVSGSVVTAFKAAGPGKVTIEVTQSIGAARICAKTSTVAKAGTVKVSCKLTAKTTKALARAPITVIVRTTFTDKSGKVFSASKTLTLKRTAH